MTNNGKNLIETNLLNDKDLQKLVRNIERGKCVLMLGADIPSDRENNAQPSLTTLFARHLTNQLASRAQVFDPDDLPHVAQIYLSNRIGDRDDLEMEAENFYRSFQGHTTNLHLCLAKMPFNYCISITPDDLMSNAFKVEEVNKSPNVDFYHFRSGNKPLSVTPDKGTPLIYKLYGDITDSRSLVLTETDLLDFLAKVISGCPEIPPMLRTLFSDKNTSFLFVGFGFQRWYLRVLLHFFRHQTKEPSWSLALEDNQFFSNPAFQQTAFFYDHSHAIEFKYCSWNEFANSLLSRYQEKTSIFKKSPEKPLSADAPRIFLCHSSKDSEAVGRFGEKLRGLGLNTWRDRDNLRGGDRWDSLIQHVISNQIDYFLLLQTPNMLAESQSYFIKEIKSALQRQEQNWSDFLFIIPAFYSGNSEQKLEVLNDLNFRDLRDDKELERLVKDIQEDKKQRLARKESAHAN